MCTEKNILFSLLYSRFCDEFSSPFLSHLPSAPFHISLFKNRITGVFLSSVPPPLPSTLPPPHPTPLASSTQLLPRPERVLGDGKAGAFDHEARAFPFLHRRLRRLLCGRENDTLLKIDPQFSRDGREKDGDDACCFGAEDEEGIFDAHAWQEEAPQCQLNGGSDPVVVTATYVVSYRQGWAVRSSSSGSAGMEGWGAASGSGGGVMLRIRAYNTTNAKLLGFVIRLSFGQGVEAAGMGDGGRVETSVDEVWQTVCASPVSFRWVSWKAWFCGHLSGILFVTRLIPD